MTSKPIKAAASVTAATVGSRTSDASSRASYDKLPRNSFSTVCPLVASFDEFESTMQFASRHYWRGRQSWLGRRLRKEVRCGLSGEERLTA
jgi:hypothetical protein